MKFYIQKPDGSELFIVDAPTPEHAVAKLLERRIDQGEDLCRAYLHHMGREDEADIIESAYSFWLMSYEHRRAFSKAIRQNYPKQYREWCDVVVATTPEDEDY